MGSDPLDVDLRSAIDAEDILSEPCSYSCGFNALSLRQHGDRSRGNLHHGPGEMANVYTSSRLVKSRVVLGGEVINRSTHGLTRPLGFTLLPARTEHGSCSP